MRPRAQRRAAGRLSEGRSSSPDKRRNGPTVDIIDLFLYTNGFFDAQRRVAPECHLPDEALQQKLDASGVRHRNLEAELEEQDEKMRQMQSKLAKKEREVFRLATDAEEFGQQARELAHELDDTKRELLDKTTEALIEKKRSEELQAKRKTTDAELKRMAEEVEAQREELLELRMSAAARVEGRQAERQEEREYRFGEEEVEGELRAEVENLRAELKATKELLQGRVQQVEELRHELQAAGGLKNWRHEELLAQKEAELAAAKAEVVELRTQLARGGVKKIG